MVDFLFEQLEGDRDAREGDRMRERNQLGRALCRLNRGDAGDAEHVALLGAPGGDQAEGGRAHA